MMRIISKVNLSHRECEVKRNNIYDFDWADVNY